MIKLFFISILIPSFALAQTASFEELPTILECDKSKILYSEEKEWIERNPITNVLEKKGDYIRYKYISDVSVSPQEYNGYKEDMSKRTHSSQFFPSGRKTVAKIYAGQVYYTANGRDWVEIRWGDITKDGFERETRRIAIPFFPREAHAAADSRTYHPESDVSVNLTPSSGSDNYAMVDDVGLHDSSTTHVTNTTTSYVYDYYGIPDHDSRLDSWTITDVELIGVGFGCDNWLCGGDGEGGRMELCVDDSSHSPSCDTEVELDGTYTYYTYDMGATNPLTSAAWTWSDIDGLYIGVGLKEEKAADAYVLCTQLYLLVKAENEYAVGSGDGYVYATCDYDTTSWATCRGYADAASADASKADVSEGLVNIFAKYEDLGVPTGEILSVCRGFFPVDTSGLPDSITVTDAYFHVFNYSVSNAVDYRLVQTTQASTSALTTADYNDCGDLSCSTAGATDLTASAGSWLKYTLNATGKGWIDTTGWTKLGLREVTCDCGNIEPGVDYGISIRSSESIMPGVTPYLEVHYTEGVRRVILVN